MRILALALLACAACAHTMRLVESGPQDLVVLDETREVVLAEATFRAQRIRFAAESEPVLWFNGCVTNPGDVAILPRFELLLVDRVEGEFQEAQVIPRTDSSPLVPPGETRGYDIGFPYPPGLERDDIVQHQLELRVLVPAGIPGSSSFGVRWGKASKTYRRTWSGIYRYSR